MPMVGSWWLYKKGVNSRPGRAEGGRFCEGLGLGFIRDVGGGLAREEYVL